METLNSGGPPEKWAASQCLAIAGYDADVVVKELFNSINSPDVIKHSKAMNLLTRLSKQSVRVNYSTIKGVSIISNLLNYQDNPDSSLGLFP